MGVTEFVFEINVYEQLKPKYGIFLQGFPVAMVPTFYITKMTKSFSAIIGV